MLNITLMGFALAAAWPFPQTAETLPVDCSYDLDAMLTLDRDAFDQDMDGGWRVLALKGCDAEAAELIRAWRHEKRDHRSILYWHEAQLRANAGQTAEAIALMKLTYSAPEFDEGFGWNHYVSGSIAFLERDRDRLRRMIDRLKAVPQPEGVTFRRPDGTIRKMQWPPNLNVLEAFERCWDQPYADAYGTKACITPDTED